ncbi:MAG: alpha-glucan family phosphorylase [Deltaproteobacteria bacterium]|nr:alpha-glucan family phosphorylase [Deltaproteobacteria bacterium]
MMYLFEVSWEVCNLVGGIYTVLRSKAPEVVKSFEDNYFLLGPLLEGNNADFLETDDPEWNPLQEALEKKGLHCRFGRWRIDGQPKVILVGFKDRYDPEKTLFNLWQQFGVDSMTGGWDYIEPVLFSTACGEVIETICETIVSEDDQIVAHFHEWMCGGGLLYLKKNTPEVGTVFTTHATILGRSMSGSGVNIYSESRQIDPETDAVEFGVLAKHSMESVCAREADCFTTVSDVTSEEAAVILSRRPHVVVANGIDVKGLPDLETLRRDAGQTRGRLRDMASRFLQRSLPDQTRFWATSGRYEFHNKGYDLFLESLARLDREVREDDEIPPIVAWFILAVDNDGLRADVRRRVSEVGRPELGWAQILTHRLHDEQSDPIVQACHRLGLNNSRENKVCVIFTPAYIDGDDGLFDASYANILPAFDLGVFPSFYEPWGYTPLESIAWGVPTVTTDLAGFGRWAREHSAGRSTGVTIIDRAGKPENDVVGNLAALLGEFSRIGDKELEYIRENAREVAEEADWEKFFRGYLDAYGRSAKVASKRLNLLDTSSFSNDLFIAFQGTEGPGPHYRTFTVTPTLPEEIADLRTIAYNLWWSWHPEAEELFSELSPDLWEESRHNPVHLLGNVGLDQLEEKAEDKAFCKKYERVIEQFVSYLEETGRDFGEASNDGPDTERPIVYFSMEFCLHECLPIYSGGLGVLSGDHLKAASDLGIPLVGIGMLYRQGYFQQHIDHDGNQFEEYPFLDLSTLPIKVLRDDHGKEVRVTGDVAGVQVSARVWQVNVGRVKLYLLDTDVDENTPRSRQISWQLYGGGRRTRIEQEILLGFAGVQLVEDKLGLSPSVYHLNEGHCGFLLFERIRRFLGRGLSFQEAREAVKATSVFTTHTPVPAGNESFAPELMKHYFQEFAPRLGIPFDQLMEMGLSRAGEDSGPFSMTVLALKLTSQANAVSELHGSICRGMWRDVWKGVAVEEVPIDSITNGIHLTSWLGKNLRRLFSQYLDIQWDGNHDDPDTWLRVDDIPSEMLWYEHMAQKQHLIEMLRKKTLDDYVARGENANLIRDTVEGLNPEALTIGFARRFATYKRATLLFRDRDALARLLNNPERPVQILFAGKAHPADVQGKEMIRHIVEECRTDEFKGKIVYLENYDMALGRLMTQGVDVWLNNPVRPHEASGTSGMKVAPNGGLNCSILDGWWDEAYDPALGWAIDSHSRHVSREHQDEMDNTALMTLLEQEIIPRYYDVDEKGIPKKWIQTMREALKRYAPQYSTMRMVSEYHRKMYLPTAARGLSLSDDDFVGIRNLTEWKRKIGARFSTVQIDRVMVKGIEGDLLAAGALLEVEMYVRPGRLRPHELRAELIIGPGDGERFTEPPATVHSAEAETVDNGNQLKFRISHRVEKSGSFLYALRVVPIHHLLSRTQETGLVRWA